MIHDGNHRLNKFETFLLFMWQSGFEEDAVGPVLSVEQRVIPPDTRQPFNTIVPLVEVPVRLAQRFRATRTAKCPTGCYLHRWLNKQI